MNTFYLAREKLNLFLFEKNNVKNDSVGCYGMKVYVLLVYGWISFVDYSPELLTCCNSSQSKKAEGCKSSNLKIRQEDDKELKRYLLIVIHVTISKKRVLMN